MNDKEEMKNVLSDYRKQLQEKNFKEKVFDEDYYKSEKFIEDYKKYLKTRLPYLTDECMEDFIKNEMCMDLESAFETEFDKGYGSNSVYTIKVEIEKCIQELGYEIHDGVSIGLIEQPRLNAEQQRVILTEGSVINISKNIEQQSMRFGRLLAMSMDVNESLMPNFSHEKSHDIVMGNKGLMFNWCDFYWDNYREIEYPIFRNDLILKSEEQRWLGNMFSESMLFFVIAHEYGHHCLKHHEYVENKSPIDNEYEADEFAFKLYRQWQKMKNVDEFHIGSMIFFGPVLSLIMVDSIEKVSDVIDGDYSSGIDNGETPDSSTHPSIFNRLERYKKFVVQNDHLVSVVTTAGFINFFFPFMDFILRNVYQEVKNATDKGHKPEGKFKSDNDWLPN